MSAPSLAAIADTLSPSQLSAFLGCQARWFYRYVLQLPDRFTGERLLGRAVHAALAANFQQKMETREDLPTTGVMAIASEAFEAQLPEASLHEDDSVDDLHDTARACVAQFMDEAAPAIVPAAVETLVSGKIGGVEVRGFVDLLDADGRVIDFKTAKKSPHGVSSDYRNQVATYATLHPQACGAGKVYTAVKAKTIKVVEHSFEVGEGERKAIGKLYPLAQESMRSGLYLPNRASFTCSRKYCAYAERCVEEYGGEVL